MKRIHQVSLAAAIAVLVSVSGCKKHDAASVVKEPLHPPAALDDKTGWNAYLQDVINRNSQGMTDQATAYVLPAPGSPDYDDGYARQLLGVSETVQRGVPTGNLLAFMSPDSTKMADLIVEAFKDSPAGNMKGVIILFVGKSADSERVKNAVANSGATFRFVEAQ